MREFTVIGRKDGKEYMMDKNGMVIRHLEEEDRYILRKVKYYSFDDLGFWIVVAAIAGFFIGAFAVGIVMQHLNYQCYDGGYIQAMKNCIASHDFNSSWCMMPWVRSP